MRADSWNLRVRRSVQWRVAAGCVLMSLVLIAAIARAQTQLQVYGVWHCYSDACSWASVPLPPSQLPHANALQARQSAI
jgi:hypothetical protein